MSEPAVLFDVNALVALSLTTHQHHRAAHRFLSGLSAWATCPLTESALVRLLLNPAVTGTARRVQDVTALLLGMRGDPRWIFVPDSSTLAAPMIDVSVLTGHRQVTDLHLVNLAASQGLILATFDAALSTRLTPSDRGSVRVIPM